MSPAHPLVCYQLKAGASYCEMSCEPDGLMTGFEEDRRYFFQQPAIGISGFMIDDELLELSPHETLGLGWHWTPRFYAGQVVARLLSANGNEHRYRFDVSPNPGKLGEHTFEQMLNEIRDLAPELLLGTEPGQTFVGHDGGHTCTSVQLARFRAYGQAFCTALEGVSQRPIHTLEKSRSLVRPHQVRRADAQTVRALLRTSAGAVLQNSASQRSSELHELRMDVPVPRQTMDCPANRTLMVVLNAVIVRAEDLLEEFDKASLREQEGARSSVRARWTVRRSELLVLLRKLKRIRSQQPFSSVRHPKQSSEGLVAIAAHPAYSKAQKLGWKILRSGVGGLSEEERTWLSPTWEIYERWCYAHIAKLLQQQYPHWSWRQAWGNRAELIGVGPEEKRLRLTLQQPFHAYDQSTKSGYRSISGYRIPDVVLTYERGDERSCWVFDAKYRTRRENVLDAMASAHIYHDALRVDGRRVQYALLLVPAGGGALWLQDEEFIRKERVGVLVCSPENTGTATSLLLNEMLRIV